jgi:hypothetical protein
VWVYSLAFHVRSHRHCFLHTYHASPTHSYMQRGGNWDNSDLKGAKKIRWLNSDKEYASGGFKKSQSVSIFGEGAGLDWTGKRDKTGPAPSGKFEKNYKAPNVNAMKAQADEKPKKKMFGLF